MRYLQYYPLNLSLKKNPQSFSTSIIFQPHTFYLKPSNWAFSHMAHPPSMPTYCNPLTPSSFKVLRSCHSILQLDDAIVGTRLYMPLINRSCLVALESQVTPIFLHLNIIYQPNLIFLKPKEFRRCLIATHVLKIIQFAK